MHRAFCVSVFVVLTRLIFCEDDCGPPHEVNRAKVSNPSDTGYALGSTVTYKCDYGFITGGALRTSRCVRDPATNQLVWTQPELTCSPRSCGDPGSVENARRTGSRFTFPNNVEYVCNEGYKISGPSRRYCEASGTWSGRLPSCTVVSCGRPGDPENGKAVYTSLTYNSELRYECNRDLQLSSKEQRYCGPDGQWTGTKPVCREIECEMPTNPEFGTVEFNGNKPNVGSIVIYRCDPGRRIVGSASSKCLKSGEWTFPPPLCVEPCVVPSVANGELGKHEQEYKRRYGWRPVFITVSEGETLDENEEVILKCRDGYVPKSQPLREITVTCRRGLLSPQPECVSTTCLDDPPGIDNGRAMVGARYHGYTIWYKCDHGFDRGRDGKVECVYGTWKGPTPTCVSTRCDKSSLNYPGLARSQGFLFNGQSFVPTCLSGYEVTEKSDKKIYCRSGSWSGNLPPCTKAQCKTEELAGFSGLVLEGYRTLDEGEWFQPRCAEGFEFYNKLDSRIYCREGTLQGNLPPCSPAHCSNNPPVPDNGKIKSFRASGHGSSVEYECLKFYEMIERGNVVCNHGQWSGSPPTCKDTRCYLRDLREKDGVDLTDENPINSHRRANIVCISGYNLKYPEVYCENGEWKTQNLLSPCQEDECEVKQIPHGTILKEKSIPIKNIWGYQTGTETVREAANIGSVESNGAVLYVECNGQHRFQGEEESQKQVSTTCRRGEWTPFPVCMLPGKPVEPEIPKADEEVPSVPPAVLPTRETVKLDDSMIQKPSTNHSVRINGQKPDSSNTSVGEDFNGGVGMLENNSTENEEVVVTEATVHPPCSCKYEIQNRILQAHDGKKLVRYGDDIPSGSIIAFYCDTTGYFRLSGPPSLMCPVDCDWNSRLFPSCVVPKEEDVIIRVFANPTYNMKVGPGGVISVIPGTRLELKCRANKGYRQYVDWTAPGSDGFKQTAIDGSHFRMTYIVPNASFRNSGKYTCFIDGGAFHTVDIEVGDVECPEIESTEQLAVSYAPHRKFGGRANFHCFFPYKTDGPSYVTCEASGFWSGPPSSCSPQTCSIGSLYDVIPEKVVPLIEGVIEENVPYGYELRLGCDQEGTVLQGGNTAVCDAEEKWKAGDNLQCVKGCASVRKKSNSELLIFPDKELYSMGESIEFSCPEGKDLTIDVQRILCFSSGWTPNTIPDCQ